MCFDSGCPGSEDVREKKGAVVADPAGKRVERLHEIDLVHDVVQHIDRSDEVEAPVSQQRSEGRIPPGQVNLCECCLGESPAQTLDGALGKIDPYPFLDRELSPECRICAHSNGALEKRARRASCAAKDLLCGGDPKSVRDLVETAPHLRVPDGVQGVRVDSVKACPVIVLVVTQRRATLFE